MIKFSIIFFMFLFSYKSYAEESVKKYFKKVKNKDRVCIIAPAYGSSDQKEAEEIISNARKIVVKYELTPYFYENILVPGNHSLFSPPDLRFANSDEERYKQLEHALHNQDCALIWCLRGGYGSVKLLKKLRNLDEPQSIKIFIGFSDITILHTFLNKKWGWPTLHFGMPGALQNVMEKTETIKDLQQVIFGEVHEVVFRLTRIGLQDNSLSNINGVSSGGNIVNFARTFGTEFQIDLSNKILVFEEVGEEARWLDGFLEQLQLIPNFEKISAIVFGTITPLDKAEIFDQIISDFQKYVNLPVFKIVPEDTVGHGGINRVLPLGAQATIYLKGLSKNIKMFVQTGLDPVAIHSKNEL